MVEVVVEEEVEEKVEEKVEEEVVEEVEEEVEVVELVEVDHLAESLFIIKPLLKEHKWTMP